VDGFPGRRVEVIENGIDVDAYEGSNRDEARAKLGLDAGRRYVVHVARHHPVKDQATLLKAFALVSPEYADVDLLMVGDGPLRGELEALAAKFGIANRVRFVGVRADVPDWLTAADVFALTSVSEAASLTLLEAMAAGRPVVVSAVGGNPEIVRDGVEGLHFPRGDAAACAECFRRLLDDPEYAEVLGESGRARARAKYRLDDTIAAYHGLYRRLAGR
jgi:glycosyltransferase involved in cell wall biosynthesis